MGLVMADDLTTGPTEEANTPEQETPTPRRRRRRQPTVGGAPKSTRANAKLEARTEKVRQTLTEATRWRLRDDSDSELSFAETVKQEADNIAHAIAAIGYRVKPFGSLIDLLFGETGPLSILVALAPTIRAGRRELAGKMRARAARRQAEAEAAALAEQEAGYVEPPNAYATDASYDTPPPGQS